MLTARFADNTIPQNKMIRPCTDSDVPNIFAIVNDAAQAYKGVIPPDRWHEPYMPVAALKEDMLIPLTPAMFGARLADGQAEISGNFDRVSRAIF